MKDKTIEIRKDKLQELYKILTNYPIISKEQVDNEMCKVFGKDVLKKPVDVRERVKTFDDACRELGEEHQFVKAFRSIYTGTDTDIAADPSVMTGLKAVLNTMADPKTWAYARDKADSLNMEKGGNDDSTGID